MVRSEGARSRRGLRLSASETAPAERQAADSRAPVDLTFSRIVGVGASAGGLEAFTELLNHLPDDTGMAFVLIQHLDPNHESHLTELLSKESKMPVSEVKGETRAAANHVYVIPPQHNLTISGGVLHDPPRPTAATCRSTHSFMRWRRDRGNKAIGVILSGTASDGTLGLKAIKAAGGITFAQDVQTARYDSMPRSAIATGVVDFVLAPAEIARQLAAIGRNSQLQARASGTAEPAGESGLARILHLVRSATGVDFTHYKRGTLERRIKRRMALRGFEKLEGLQPGSRAESPGSERIVRDLLYHRHCILPGTCCLRGTEKEGVSRVGGEQGPEIRSESGWPGAPRARRPIRLRSA